MIHTEEDAKTKNCPMARVVVNQPDYSSGNRFEEIAPGTASRLDECARCIASACMLWVESEPLIETSIIPPHQKTSGDPPSGDGWTLGVINGRNAWVRTTSRRGYCGLIQSPR